MRVLFLCILSLVFILNGNAQQIIPAITSDGKSVELHPDGTWKIKQAEEMQIELLDFSLLPRDKDYEQGRLYKDIVLTLHLKNVSGSRIRGYRISVDLMNGFGDLMNTLTLTDGKTILENNQSTFTQFVFQDNSFIDDDVYSNLMAFSEENLQFIIRKAQVLIDE